MPQITVWKHPRKKAYTENKHLHVRRLKTEARKSYHKRRNSEILAELKAELKKVGTLNNFAEFIQFLENNKFLLAKLICLQDNKPLSNIDVNPFLVVNFVLNLQNVTATFDGKKRLTVVIETHDQFEYWPHTRILRIIVESLLGNPIYDGSRGKVSFDQGKKINFNDVYDLVKQERINQEEENIVSKLSGNEEKMPRWISLTKEQVSQLKLSTIEKVYTAKPITLDTIGQKVLYLHSDGTNPMFVKAELISFVGDHAILNYHNCPIGVKLNEVKNIF